jgi:hypothetical protein
MTEYDYSPGASERYQDKLRSIGNWAKDTAAHSQEFSHEVTALSHSQYSDTPRSFPNQPPVSSHGGYSASMLHPGNAPPTSFPGSRAHSARPSPHSGLAPLPPMLVTSTMGPGMSISQAPSPQPPPPIWMTVPQQQQQPQYANPFIPPHQTLAFAPPPTSYIPPPQSYAPPPPQPFAAPPPPLQMPVPFKPQQFSPPVLYPAPPSIQHSLSGQLNSPPSMATIVIQDERRNHKSGHRSRSPSRTHRKHKSDRENKKSRSPASNTYIIAHPQQQQQHNMPCIVLPRHGEPKFYVSPDSPN